MTKINITNVITYSIDNDMASDVAANMADDVAFSKKPGPLVVGFILILGH